MKTGILFDIHGNLEALNSSLEVLADTDKIVHGGDLIGWGAEPSKVIDTIRKYKIDGISGNHEFLVRGVYHENHADRNISTSWTQQRISEEQLKFISKLPAFMREKSFYIFHATPHQYTGTPTASDFPYLRKSEDFLPFIKDISSTTLPLILIGHIHIPACYSICTKSNTIESIKLPSSLDGHKILYKNNEYKKTIVVGGSLGWPRNGEKVFVLVVDDKDETVTFREVFYNIDAYLKSMGNEYPKRLKDIFNSI